MKLVNQTFEILGTPQSLEEAWSFVAKAARNCYQSEKTREDETEEDFCKRILLKHPEDLECDHMSPFEFGIVYLIVSDYGPDEYGRVNCMMPLKGNYKTNPYSRIRFKHWEQKPNDLQKEFCVSIPRTTEYITTNLRVIIENGWEEDLKYAVAPTKYHVKACCFKFDTSIHVYKDLTRHRTLSFCIESTRFCRYSSEKHGKGLKFIMPIRLNKYSKEELCIDDEGYWNESQFLSHWTNKPREAQLILSGLQSDEYTYLGLINECGWTAQEAATKLPQDTKGTVMMCGYEDNLQHMFRLRAEECSGPVLPQVAEIIKPMYEAYKVYKEEFNSTLND